VAAVPLVAKVPHESPEGATTSTEGPPDAELMREVNAYALPPRTMRKSCCGREASQSGAVRGAPRAGTTASQLPFCMTATPPPIKDWRTGGAVLPVTRTNQSPDREPSGAIHRPSKSPAARPDTASLATVMRTLPPASPAAALGVVGGEPLMNVDHFSV